jgi:hypothetical protein
MLILLIRRTMKYGVQINTDETPCIPSFVKIGTDVNQFGGGLEYLHHSPVSRKRRRKGKPVAGGITGPPCPWGI